MNLRTKHILAVSAVAGIAGLIGYLIGNKAGYERGYSDALPEEEEFEIGEYRGVRKKDPKPEWTEVTPNDIVSLEKRARGLKGKSADMLIWDEVDLNNITDVGTYEIKQKEPDKLHYDPELTKKANDYIKKTNVYKSDDDIEEDEEGTDDEEDIENLRTQGEVEYTSKEPYLVTEDDVFTDETNPDEVEQLTYYKADDVLADSFDDIIVEKSLVLGSISKEFLQGFAGGETIYIRNPITRRDYELFIRDTAYEIEVLGADDEQYLNAVKFFNIGNE